MQRRHVSPIFLSAIFRLARGVQIRVQVAIALAVIVLPGTALAEPPCASREGLSVVCSATWQFNGTCEGHDMWQSWKVGGYPPSPDAFVRPWLDLPIVVIGYELVKLQASTGEVSAGGWWQRLQSRLSGRAGHVPGSTVLAQSHLNETMSWFAVGSTIQTDITIWLAPGQSHAKQMYPAGYGQPWPSRSNAKPTKPHTNDKREITSVEGDLIDLHGLCFGGGPVTILLTIYYIVSVEQAAQRATSP
jgi:hypothetical protein